MKKDTIHKVEKEDIKWVQNDKTYVFELGDGCCEHLYMMPKCPHLSCKVCPRKKIYPRHILSVKQTIESYSKLRDDAKLRGLILKSNEFQEIVDYYSKALIKIMKNEVFDAEKDL